MFIQMVCGKVKDAAAMKAASDKWQSDLRPGASGYLGVTSGVADDGTFIAVVRFADEAAARANSDRPEQGAWWEQTSKLFDGSPAFYDCPNVDLIMGGGSDAAGFVQVMIYKPSDGNALRAMSKEFEKLAPMRPDVIGGTSAQATDGTFVDTNYFTSETEAREGEKQPMTPEIQDLMGRFGALAGPVEFIDLRDPWLHS